MKLDKKILTEGLVGFLAFFLIVTYIGYSSQSAVRFSAVTLDVNNDGAVNIYDLKYCVNYHLNCDYSRLINAIRPRVMTFSVITDCGFDAYQRYDANHNCYIDESEMNQATSDESSASISDTCWLDITELWANSVKNPNCPATTTTTLAGEIPPAEHYPSNAVVTKTLTVSTTKQVDTHYQDGDVLYLKGKWTLLKDGAEVDGGTADLTTGSYSYTLNRAFNEDGNYIFSVVIYSAESHYTSTGWSDYSYNEEAKAIYPFTVGYPQPPAPIWTQIWNNFIKGLTTIWDTITGWVKF